MEGNIPIASSISLQKYSQLISDGLSLLETTATRIMAMHITRTVMEKRPMRMSFIFKAILLFQSKATGTEMTAEFVRTVGRKDASKLTQEIRDHIESTVEVEGHLLELDLARHSTLRCSSQYEGDGNLGRNFAYCIQQSCSRYQQTCTPTGCLQCKQPTMRQ